MGRRSQEPAGRARSQEEPGGATAARGQEEPGAREESGLRRSHNEQPWKPGGARRNQEAVRSQDPGGVRSSLEEPAGTRGQEEPGARRSQEPGARIQEPEGARSLQEPGARSQVTQRFFWRLQHVNLRGAFSKTSSHYFYARA